jgi:hypothetical protein
MKLLRQVSSQNAYVSPTNPQSVPPQSKHFGSLLTSCFLLPSRVPVVGVQYIPEAVEQHVPVGGAGA